jgi:hypothetical protein
MEDGKVIENQVERSPKVAEWVRDELQPRTDTSCRVIKRTPPPGLVLFHSQHTLTSTYHRQIHDNNYLYRNVYNARFGTLHQRPLEPFSICHEHTPGITTIE